MIDSAIADCISVDKMNLSSLDEKLRGGIWPRSVPMWIAAFYVALFIIRPWEQLFPWLGDIHFERIYALCMIGVVLLSSKKQFHMSFQIFMVVLFFIAIGLSALFARNPSLAWEPFYEYLTFVIFFFILILVIRASYELVFMVTCYIVSMAVYLAKSQWEFFVHGQNQFDMGVIRLTGISNTFGGPNSLAMSIIVSLPMLLFLWSVRKEFSCGWPSFWRRWFTRFLVFYAVLAVSSIILTNSRSGMVSFILFVALTTFRGRRIGKKLGYIMIGILILGSLWFIIPEENKNRFRTIWDPEAGPVTAQISAEGRIEGYRAGMTMFGRFPLSGVGIGNFVDYRMKYVDGMPLQAHNLYGQVMGETGVIGGLTFFLLVSVTLINCHRVRVLARRKHSDSKLEVLSGLSLACRDAIILLAFEGLFGHNLLRFNWLWLAAFSSLALQFAKQRMEEKKDKL